VTHEAISSRVSVDGNAPLFNAGVFAVRFDRWRADNITGKIEEWIQLRDSIGSAMWNLATQPPMLLALYGRVQWIDTAWNTPPRRIDSTGKMQRAKLLHFVNNNKPWLLQPLASNASGAPLSLWLQTISQLDSPRCSIAYRFPTISRYSTIITAFNQSQSPTVNVKQSSSDFQSTFLTTSFGFIIGMTIATRRHQY
jgi:lipopolysaccharide biosynthesis glycosyltransferase